MATMTDSELVKHLLDEQAKLHARLSNLEVALHGMWAMLQDLQPPATQQAVGNMMREHFQAMEDMGTVRMGLPTFERA